MTQGQIDAQLIFAGLGIISLILCIIFLIVLMGKLNRARIALTALNQKLEVEVRDRMIALAQSNIELEQEVAIRAKAEDLLLESEAKYRFLAENISDVIWLYDLTERQLTYLSSSVTPLSGYTPEEVMAKTSHGALYTGEVQKVISSIEQAFPETLAEFNGMQLKPDDFIVKAKDGSSKWIETLVRCHINETNQHIELLGVSRDITVRKQSEEDLSYYTYQLERQQIELHQQATRDSLTGAYNRRYFEEILDMEVSRAKENHDPLSLVMIDIDHFKKVNDTLGHLAGDHVLKELVKFYKKNIREGDIVCRYGGEEFVVLLPKAPLEVAMRRAKDWRQALQNLPILFSGQEIRVSVSMGISTLQEKDESGELLFKQADQALYCAKGSGRNCIMAYDQSIAGKNHLSQNLS